MYLLERNRLLMLRTNYRPLSLLVLSPALLCVEIGTSAVALRDGWFGEKLKAWRDAVVAPDVASARRLVEANRMLTDAEMLETMEFAVSGMRQIEPPKGSGAVDWLLGLWKTIALRLLRIIGR